MNLNQAAQSILNVAPSLALALAVCGADRQLRDAVEDLWYLSQSPEGPSPTEGTSPTMPVDKNEEPLGPGSTVAGRFRILSELGHGGTATVYHAESETGTSVALKISYPGSEAAAGTCPLRAEYAAASAIHHPNVRRVDELFTLEPRRARVLQAMVMEYIEGETLARRISRGPLPGDELERIARGIAAGLDAIHAAGLVHGDLKPGNIVLRKDLSPAIVDLGNCGTAISPDYMSIEQFEGKPATPADDLFALGAILYEMATGNRPWPKEELLPAAIRRATKDAPPLTSAPMGYASAVAALLDRNAAARPTSATRALTLLGVKPAGRSCRHGHAAVKLR